MDLIDLLISFPTDVRSRILTVIKVVLPGSAEEDEGAVFVVVVVVVVVVAPSSERMMSRQRSGFGRFESSNSFVRAAPSEVRVFSSMFVAADGMLSQDGGGGGVEIFLYLYPLFSVFTNCIVDVV